MKAAELRQLGDDELVQKLKETRDELFGSRVRKATGQLESTARLKGLRRDIARMETVLRQNREAVK